MQSYLLKRWSVMMNGYCHSYNTDFKRGRAMYGHHEFRGTQKFQSDAIFLASFDHVTSVLNT